MKLDFSKYHLKPKYREVLEHLSDEDKIRIALKRYRSIYTISDICEYYNLRQHPLIKTLGLKKYGKNPENACGYAYYVIKGRWKETEEVIKTDPESAYHYAYYVIKGRWIEAEEYIKTDPTWACNYAIDVIGDKNFWDKQNET
jgi:hypothetical protein